MNWAEIVQVTIYLSLCGALGVGMFFLASKTQKRWWRDVLKPNTGAAEVEELRLKDKAEARAAYERMIMAKFDIIKTALTMGYKDEEIKALDHRLEQLIGADKVAGLLDPGQPGAALSTDLLDQDLDSEMQRLRALKAQAKQPE